MNIEHIKQELKVKAQKIDDKLLSILDKNSPKRLQEAMYYSLMAGGKRLRPILCLSCAELFTSRADSVLPFACAIEMIHTYSLIHDDLPAMDNDDLRRGKPTCHKAYDEATAILAGDGLLTDAFFIMLTTELEPSLVNLASAEIAGATGSVGMVGGQILDIEFTNYKIADLERLRAMHLLKTGALIKASCVSGAILGGATDDELKRIADYGRYLGLAFQIIDDILDVIGDTKTLGKPVGSDAKQGKLTYPAIVGIDKSYELATEASQQALAALDNFAQADFLRGLVHLMQKRVS